MADLAALQTELKAAKEKWSDIKLGKGKKESETFPYPIWLSQAVQQPPSAAAFDVNEIPVKLLVDGLEDGQRRVECISTEIPPKLRPQIEAEVLKIWNKAGKKDSPWGIVKTLDWVETNFSKMLMLDPECVGAYEGCDEMGATMRRYAIGQPAEPVEEESESEDGSEDDEAAAQAAYAAKLAELLSMAEAEDSSKKKLSPEEIERRKEEAAEMGEKAKMLSKKERDELNKSRKEKSGHRTAKTGAASKKFEGEGSTTKEEKKKKNDANVKKRYGLA